VLLEGLEEGRAAIIVRLSHALTDSVGPSELLAAVLDSQRWPDKGPMPPAPSPQAVTPEELLSRSLGDFPAEAVDATRHLIAAVGNPQNLRSVLAGAVDFTESLGRVLASVGPPSPLLAGRSLRRRCAAFEVGMQDLKRSGNAVDASIGDVYLGCITEALRLYHDALHDPVENLPLAIPVGLRGPGGGASGNRFGALLIAAPLVAKNAAKRVALISRVVREGRAESAIDAVTVAAPLLARLPASMLRALAGLTPRPDILASSFPGLSKPRYIAGAKVLKSYTFGPVPGVAAMFTMQSIAGGCFISVNYDPAAIRYSDLFAKCLTRGFRTTLRLGGQRPQVGPVAVARMRDQEMAA
jgi:diacylglycerol O-acyltransferase